MVANAVGVDLSAVTPPPTEAERALVHELYLAHNAQARPRLAAPQRAGERERGVEGASGVRGRGPDRPRARRVRPRALAR
eukprot:6971209-Prymnesium_polylepis.1